VVKVLWADPHRFSRAERFYAQKLLDPLSAVVASRRAHLAHERSEARYRTLFDNATDAIIIHDQVGNLLEVNHVACDQLGYSRDALLSMTVQDISGEQPPMAHSAWIQGADGAGSLTFETVHIRKDGTEVPVEVSGRPIDYRGQAAILCAARDISERLAMERQLHRQERLAAVGQLAGGIAHDFRNFLTTIILYSGMPLAKQDLSPETEHALEVITNEAQQASDLVQQILDFSGRSAMEMQPVNLVDFIEEAAGILRQTIPESIKVSLAIEPSSSVVEADPTRIQQILMNLVLNARDAMTVSEGDSETEGGELEIALAELVVPGGKSPPVAGMEPGEWVRLTVSDSGTGMTDAVKERIFEPFFTTKERGEGTGLGLAQVYGIVQQHDGHIDVETDLGVGTSFHVYLPLHGGETSAEPALPTGELPTGRGETILLVEDQQKLREAGHGMLSSLGYRVVTAANGQEAMEILGGMHVDLVVTDVVMPEMGGKALARALAETYPHLPAIAVTGYTMRDEISELKHMGFAEVLQKPFDGQLLAEAVGRALGKER
jgi:PAS domain S-box-containing protein